MPANGRWNLTRRLNGLLLITVQTVKEMCLELLKTSLTLSQLTWRIRWASNNASKWQMEFNSAFKWFITYYSPNGRRNVPGVTEKAVK